jgi:hypothetical protein
VFLREVVPHGAFVKLPAPRAWLGVMGALAFAAVAGAYFSLIQPGGLYPPSREVMEQLREDAEHPVFAYGTLTSPVVRIIVTWRLQETRPARLRGYRREDRNIVPDARAVVEGIAFDVTPRELRRLDLYERVGERYERISVILKDGEAAWAYRALK